MAKQEKQPPAIIAEELDPWGHISDADVAGEGRQDPWFVAGYSDKKREHDTALREWRLGRGPKPDPIPYRFQYVRTTLMSGAPDNSKPSEYIAKGYIPVQYDDAAKFGIDVQKSGFARGPDGTCRVANQMLMITPTRIASIHAKKLEETTKALSEGASSRLQTAVDDFNARVGAKYGKAEVFQEEEMRKD
jgi:hypothetical protein